MVEGLSSRWQVHSQWHWVLFSEGFCVNFQPSTGILSKSPISWRTLLILGHHPCFQLGFRHHCHRPCHQMAATTRGAYKQTSDNMESWEADETCSQVSRKKCNSAKEMLEKSRHAVFFQWFVCRVSWKVGLLKRRVRRKVLSRAKIARCCGEKHILKSKCQKAEGPEALFWVLMLKNARRCGEKHIHKSKCTKHLMLGALFEVRMSKTCTPLWRKAHYEVKMSKKLRAREHFLKFWCPKKCTLLWRKAHSHVKMPKLPHAWSTFWSFDVENLHAAVTKSTLWSQNA